MLIIVTGTVAPAGTMGNLVLRDHSERLRQYRQALERLITAKPDAAVVFCENSGFGTEAFAEVQALAERTGVRFEALSFAGDTEAAARHGKGYGEGEILSYVMENSALAAGEEYFVKLTGRLTVDNLPDLVKRLKTDTVYFNIPNIHRREFYDTRLYAMPTAVFREHFREAYRQVREQEGRILETVYTEVIRSSQLRIRNFPRYPRIVGTSGSVGIPYAYTEWKSKIRDFLSLFNCYGRVC